MKKSLIVLAVLLLVGGFVYAEAEISGEAMFGAADVFTEDISSSTFKAEINISADVDENTSVKVELDAEGDDWNNKNIALDDFRVTSNILGAMGVEDISLDITVGLFDTYFTNWNYVSRSSEEWGSTAAGNYLWNLGPTTDLAFALNLGVAEYNLMYWMDVAATAVNFAVSGEPVEGLNFLVGYYGETVDIAAGNVWVEGGYKFEAGAVALFVPATFAYDLDDAVYGWSSGIAADVDAYHVSVGVGGASDSSVFKDCLVEVSTSVVENADIYAIADMDFSADSAFQSVDLGGKYNFGAFGLCAGYVAASSEDVSTSLYSGTTSVTGSGLYLCADIDF